MKFFKLKEIKFYFWRSRTAWRRKVLMIYCRLTASESFSGAWFTWWMLYWHKETLSWEDLCSEFSIKASTKGKQEKSFVLVSRRKVLKRKRISRTENIFDISSSIWNAGKRTRAPEAYKSADSFARKRNRDWILTKASLKWNENLGNKRSTLQGRRQRRQLNQSMHSFRLMSCPVMGVKKNSKREKWKTTISKFNFPFPRRIERKSFYLFDILKGRTWPGESITMKKVNRSSPSNNSFARTLGYAAWRRQKKSFPRKLPSLHSIALLCNVSGYSWFFGVFLSSIRRIWLEHAFPSSGNVLGSGFVSRHKKSKCQDGFSK